MNTRKLIRVTGILILAVTVSLAMLALIYALQNPEVMVNVATIGWNGYISS